MYVDIYASVLIVISLIVLFYRVFKGKFDLLKNENIGFIVINFIALILLKNLVLIVVYFVAVVILFLTNYLLNKRG